MKNTITAYVLLLFFACALMFALHISYQKEISKLKSELKERRDIQQVAYETDDTVAPPYPDTISNPEMVYADGAAKHYVIPVIAPNIIALEAQVKLLTKSVKQLNKRIDSLETRIPTWVDENDILLNDLLQKTYQPDTLRLKFTPNK